MILSYIILCPGSNNNKPAIIAQFSEENHAKDYIKYQKEMFNLELELICLKPVILNVK